MNQAETIRGIPGGRAWRDIANGDDIIARSALFKSSIGKKFFVAVTGLFLIAFLIVHVSLNSLIFLNDGGVTFSRWAHFMELTLRREVPRAASAPRKPGTAIGNGRSGRGLREQPIYKRAGEHESVPATREFQSMGKSFLAIYHKRLTMHQSNPCSKRSKFTRR